MLEAGKRVRILRAGLDAPIGVVVAVYPQARRTRIGTRYPGADVELDNGEVMFVPHTNLDLIV